MWGLEKCPKVRANYHHAQTLHPSPEPSSQSNHYQTLPRSHPTGILNATRHKINKLLSFLFLPGRPQTPPEFIYKKLCFYSCLNFSHLQSTLYLMQYTCWHFSSDCSKQSLNSLILMSFSASAIFCFPFFTSGKPLPLRTFFI